MSLVNSLLAKRLKAKEKSPKMAEMAKQSATGNLTTFSGFFNVVDLASHERELLEVILREYTEGDRSIEQDLESLVSITSEVKAINNQAAILHGERIKRAQEILTEYRDGAFTSWMIAAYGNRQTPYNFLQYFEFWNAMPKLLRPQIESMPRQAIYTLASREGPQEKKKYLVENYQGETKQELLEMIRESFPLPEDDKRKKNSGDKLIEHLQRCITQVNKIKKLSKKQKIALSDLLDHLKEVLTKCKAR